jgi:hypothetical protein
MCALVRMSHLCTLLSRSSGWMHAFVFAGVQVLSKAIVMRQDITSGTYSAYIHARVIFCTTRSISVVQECMAQYWLALLAQRRRTWPGRARLRPRTPWTRHRSWQVALHTDHTPACLAPIPINIAGRPPCYVLCRRRSTDRIPGSKGRKCAARGLGRLF